jgi:hypothetical protein
MRANRGQIAVLAAVLILLFVLVTCGLIDVYHAEETRNWAYRAAQQAAMAGVSKGRNWDLVLAVPDPLKSTPDPSKGECENAPWMDLKMEDAYSAAQTRLVQEIGFRNVTGYHHEIRVIPSALGGAESDFPPNAVRLGQSRGHWQTNRPAVGVYLAFSVDTYLLSFIGIGKIPIEVFAAAEVVQPPQCTPQAP